MIKRWINSFVRWTYFKYNLSKFDSSSADYCITINYLVELTDKSKSNQKTTQVFIKRGNSQSLAEALLALEQVNTQVMHTIKGYEN